MFNTHDHTNNDSNIISLHHYNDAYAIKIIPVIVFLAILMLVGLIGNALVLYIYTVKFKSCTTRSYVVSLALLDLINCLINMPLEIFDITHNYTFGAYGVCKLMPVLVTYSSLASGAILLIVAWERFMKICRPFKKQITASRARMIISIACVLALVLSLPAGILYGPRTVHVEFSEKNGTECTIADEYVSTLYPIIYLGFQFMMFVSVTLTLIVLYSLVWRRVLHQHRFKTAIGVSKRVSSTKKDYSRRKQHKSDDNTKVIRTSLAVMTTSASSSDLKGYSSDTLETSDSRTTTGSLEYAMEAPPITTSDKLNIHPTNVRAPTTFTTTTQKPVKEVQKVTFMLFLITLAFIISFLPYLGLMVVMAVTDHITVDTSTSKFLAFHFFLRSYFIQSVSNPFIYGFCNAKFRTELKSLLLSST